MSNQSSDSVRFCREKPAKTGTESATSAVDNTTAAASTTLATLAPALAPFFGLGLDLAFGFGLGVRGCEGEDDLLLLLELDALLAALEPLS